MKRGSGTGLISVLVFLFSVLPACAAPDSLDVVERVGATAINWSEGYIEADGAGQVPETVLDKPNAYVLALETAKANAFRNIFEIAKSVRVDSLTELRDLILQDEALKARIDALIAKSHIEERVFSYSQKQVRVVLRMPLRGELMRAVMQHYKGRKTERDEPAQAAAGEGAASANAQGNGLPRENEAGANGPDVTGLVIDARGIQPGPALLPRILDESGREIYGPLQVDTEAAVRLGLAVYCRSVACPQAESRIEKKPMMVKAIRTEGPGRSNILISSLDAEKLRAANAASPFLSKAKVVIYTD